MSYAWGTLKFGVRIIGQDYYFVFHLLGRVIDMVRSSVQGGDI